jgi:hypothetical protein
MPCPVREAITGRGFWGEILIEEDLVDLPGDRQPGLQMTDPAFRGGQLHRLIGAQAIDLATVDLLLLEPEIDRRFAHPERRGELLDTCSSTSKLDDLTTDLWRVPAGHLNLRTARRL